MVSSFEGQERVTREVPGANPQCRSVGGPPRWFLVGQLRFWPRTGGKDGASRQAAPCATIRRSRGRRPGPGSAPAEWYADGPPRSMDIPRANGVKALSALARGKSRDFRAGFREKK